MQNWPARDTPDLVAGGELVVQSPPPTEPVVRSLRPASIIEITVPEMPGGRSDEPLDLGTIELKPVKRQR